MSTATALEVRVLIGGQWQAARNAGSFSAVDPQTRAARPARFPISRWEDCDEALEAAVAAFTELRRMPVARLANFLDDFATRIEGSAEVLVETAHRESGLPIRPRLADVELPRTCNQLRLAAAACRSGDWALATIDTAANIRSCFEALGPVCVFGPNNFPFAFNSVAGGDFAAAIAAGNPVIGKANSSHPETTQRFAELAFDAIQANGLPVATVQLLYRTSHEDGERLVSDPRIGATGYTGSRQAGLKLKAAADRAGKPIYLELSSVNPVVILPGAVAERSDAIVDQYVTSVLMGAGQFCTNPGLVLLIDDPAGRDFVARVAERFGSAPIGTLLSPAVERSLVAGIQTLQQAGALRCAGDATPLPDRCAVPNTLLTTTGRQFLCNPHAFQTEAFGNAALVVMATDHRELIACLEALEGNLTGCVYSANDGRDDADYGPVASALAQRVGRLLNDKMPTGVAVSPAMNHGGPYPATGHPGFTAVGIPASLRRFAKLTCFDNVREPRLPALLRDRNPTGHTWRSIDGRWTIETIGSKS